MYSNRFAAHIIRQHQFAKLCTARGWKYQLAGYWSDARQWAARELPEWGLRAEFWVDVIDDQETESERGIARYLTTDQVRFHLLDDPGSDAPVPVDEVPVLVFSEIMRDVDLFVGVASVGNDPHWCDSGQTRRYEDYWRDYSFGELSATAATRKEVVAALLPKLKIASRCSIDGRFLSVRGELRSYKIHLGSGNILMEPNDEYLCIVPDRRRDGSGKVRLPFEGDTTLSLILSKAFLLAADDEISDPMIRSQIRGR